MPMEQITELLKDKPDLLKEVTDAFDKVGAFETVKKANSDLTAERENDARTRASARSGAAKPSCGVTALRNSSIEENSSGFGLFMVFELLSRDQFPCKGEQRLRAA